MSLSQNICPLSIVDTTVLPIFKKKKKSIGFIENNPTVKISINKIGNKQPTFVQLHILRNSHNKNITTH